MRGLWWPALPRPTVDEVEQQQRPKKGNHQLLKAVDYQLKFGGGDKHRTLPTNEVYRQVVKAYPQRTPLQLTLGGTITQLSWNPKQEINNLFRATTGQVITFLIRL